MTTTKLIVWPFIVLTAILITLGLVTAWYFNWWQWVLPWQVISISAVIITLACLFTALCWWIYLIRKKPKASSAEVDEAERKRFMQRQIILDFDLACKKQPQSNQLYASPWYILFNEDTAKNATLLTQMGFSLLENDKRSQDYENVINFWISDSAVLVAIDDIHSPYFKDNILTLLKRFKKRRPRQSANGVLLALSVESLLGGTTDKQLNLSKAWRGLLCQFNESMGLNLPIYSLLTDFSVVQDLQRLFSSYDDTRLEQPLGALMPIGEQGYTPNWFENSYREIEKQLLAQTKFGLKAQLNAHYRDSIVVGPYQFLLLKAEIGEVFNQIFSGGQYEDEVINFRGYFFTSNELPGQYLDKLTLLMASQLGYQQCEVQETDQGKSLFTKHLMQQSIIPEAGLVGVNKAKERWYRFLGFVFSGGLIAGFVLFVLLLKANFDYYQGLDKTADTQLANYRSNLQSLKVNSDDLTAPIFSLTELRNIRNIYQQQTPWYVFSWLPSPSIRKEIEQSYSVALKQVLLVAMRDYLLKDLFVFNKLEDKLKTIELYNLYQLLYDANRQDRSALESYYVNSLQAEGEGDTNTLSSFRLLITDLLKPGVVPPVDDDPLIGIVKSSLSTDDISDLLYQHILQRPGLSRRIDLRENLGQKASLVFSYRAGYSGYLMPFIFTREGFNQLLSGTDFQLATQAINDFEGVVGKITSQAELNRINRELKQRYIDDYIRNWQSFYRNIQWIQPEGITQTRSQLVSMADPLFSPLKKLQQLIVYHTDLRNVYKPEAATVTATGDTPEKLTDAQRLLEEQKAVAEKMAITIARPFSAQEQLLAKDDQGFSPLDIALKQIQEANDWVNAALAEQPKGLSFLQQLNSTEGVNPLSQLQTLADSYNDKILSQYLSVTAQQLNGLAMSEVKSFINGQWQRNVVSYYRNQIAGFYPFNKTAEQDVSLEAFQTFFAPDGRVDRFKNQYLGYFKEDANGGWNIQGFIQGQSIDLNASFWPFLNQVSEIQRTLFTAGELSVDFAVRAQGMSSGLSEISLQSERKIYRYRNGPSLWTAAHWPMLNDGTQDIELQLKSVDKRLLRVSFVGIWSWFRLADTLNGGALQPPSNSMMSIEHEGETAKLLLKVTKNKSPFISGYFTRIKLPNAL